MTYQELAKFLGTLSPVQLASEVTVHLEVEDEYFAAVSASVASEDDVLDGGHAYLTVLTSVHVDADI